MIADDSRCVWVAVLLGGREWEDGSAIIITAATYIADITIATSKDDSRRRWCRE